MAKCAFGELQGSNEGGEMRLAQMPMTGEKEKSKPSVSFTRA